MTRETNETWQPPDQKMQRLNKLASFTGLLAVLVFLTILLLIITRPPAPATSLTPQVTPSLTPTLTPSPSPTATPAPPIELIAVEYVQAGAGCQVELTVSVHGEALTGVFHVWSASHSDPAGTLSAVETLPPGLSAGYLLTLEGTQPQPEGETYEIWFEYHEGASNRLTGLLCPQPNPTP